MKKSTSTKLTGHRGQTSIHKVPDLYIKTAKWLQIYFQSAAGNVGGDVMLNIEISPITSQQQNMDDHDSPALELHAIIAVDWLDSGCSVHENNYFYSVF